MIYMVGGIKGGSGKTTIATNLTVLLSLVGREVLLIDADDQESSTDFTSWRNERFDNISGYTSVKLSGSNVRNETLSLSKKFDDVVIDTGGRDTTSQRAALTIAQVALFPFVPRSLDIWTLEKLSRLLEEIKPANQALKSYAFINRADHKGPDNEEASNVLKEAKNLEFLNTPIGNRKSFSNASSGGLGIVEYHPSDRKAILEFFNLFNNITNLNVSYEQLKEKIKV